MVCLATHFGGHFAATDGVVAATGLPLSTTAVLALGELSVVALGLGLHASSRAGWAVRWREAAPLLAAAELLYLAAGGVAAYLLERDMPGAGAPLGYFLLMANLLAAYMVTLTVVYHQPRPEHPGGRWLPLAWRRSVTAVLLLLVSLGVACGVMGGEEFGVTAFSASWLLAVAAVLVGG